MSVRVRNRGYSLLDRSEPTTASRRGGSLPVGGVAADAPGIVVRTLGPVLRPVRASLPNLFGQNGQDQSLEPNTFLLEQPRVASPAGGMTTNYDADAAATATYPARTSGVSAARSSRSKSSGMRERPSRLAAVLGVSTDDEHHDQHLVDNLDVIGKLLDNSPARFSHLRRWPRLCCVRPHQCCELDPGAAAAVLQPCSRGRPAERRAQRCQLPCCQASTVPRMRREAV